MTRPYEYFATCGGQPGVVTNLGHLGMSGSEVAIQTRVHRDYDSGGTHVSYFIPATERILPIARSLVRPKLIRALVRDARTWRADLSALDGERRMHADLLPFTGRVAIYSDCEISDADWSLLTRGAAASGVYLTFHGPGYARARAKAEHPLAFILHDSHDRSIAQRLAEHLRGFGAPVWFDEFSIPAEVGLRESIDRGMSECRRAIVIVSRSFLESASGAREELDALCSRDVESKSTGLIPIWYAVDRAEVGSYSASLADRRAFRWDPHVDRLAALIFHEMTGLHAPLRPVQWIKA